MTAHRGAARVKSRFPVSPLLPTSEDCWTFVGKPMPIIYEDEGQDEMGEANLHTLSTATLHFGIKAHMRPLPQYQVFANLNCYYSPRKRKAYFSSDVMVVEPYEPLPFELSSYRIGKHGPAPRVAIEILSERSAQQRDLTDKPVIYGQLAVAEYILVDVTGEYLPERLELMRYRQSGTWSTLRDRDGGVTSELGFRIVIDADGFVRVVDAATGRRYIRPDEAEATKRLAETGRKKEAQARRRAEKERDNEAQAREQAENARRAAEDRIRELEAELKRLRKPHTP
jgi:Uma2 family endonuclease